MRGTLRQMLARLWASLLRRRGSIGARRRNDELGRDWTAARARFWSEFSEGQREAEARKARLRSS